MTTERPDSKDGYPAGGLFTGQGGQGVFRDAETGQNVHVWVDIHLTARYLMIKQMEEEGAKIAVLHWAPEVQLLILSPRSIAIFDMYCHPSWLTPSRRCHYKMLQSKAAEQGEEMKERWRSKVILKETWWRECMKAGRFLGEADNWGGQRAGGPPVTLTLNKSPIFKPDRTVLQITPGPAREAAASDPRPPPSMPAAALLPPQGSAAVSNASPPGAAASETEDPRALRVADGTLLASDSIHGTATGSYSVSGNAVEQESDLSSPVTGVEGTATTIVQPSPAEAVLETESADPRTFQPRPASSSGQAQLGSPTKLTASLNALNEPGEEEEEQEDVEEVEEVEEKGATASAQQRHVNEDVDMESPALAVADIAVASSTSAPHHSPPTHAEEDGAVTSESRSADILAANPSQLLNGLRMWLDPKLPSRSDLLARIKRAGGTIATDYPHATHVLVHDYASNAKYWDGVIKTMTKRGVWFVHATWATKSLEDNVIQPELGFCLPGGTPSTSTLRAVQEDAKPTQLLGKGKEPRISTEDLAELFQREWNAHEGSITSLLDGIFEKYGVYSRGHWSKLFDEFRNRRGRFTDMRPLVESQSEPLSPQRAGQQDGVETGTVLESPRTLRQQQPTQPTAAEESLEQMDAGVDDDPGFKLPGVESLMVAPLSLSAKESANTELARPWPDYQPDDAQTAALERAYQQALKKRRKREKLPEPFVTESGFTNRDEWLVAYKKHHDLRASSKMPASEVIDVLRGVRIIFEERKQRALRARKDPKKKYKDSNWLYPLLLDLVHRYNTYDYDGWIELYAEWRSGNWPLSISDVPTSRAATISPGPKARSASETTVGQTAQRSTSASISASQSHLAIPSSVVPANADSRLSSADPQPIGSFARPLRIGPETSSSSKVGVDPPARPTQKLSRGELATIMCENYDKLLSMGIYKLGVTLAEQYPQYTSAKWALLANEWDHGLGRFMKVGKRYDPSGGAVLAAASARCEETTPANGTGSSEPILTRGTQPLIPTEDMDRIFRKYGPRAKGPDGLSLSELGALLETNHGGYSAATWASRYRQWTRGEGRFAGKRGSASGSLESRGTKRSHDSPMSVTGSQPSQHKRPKHAYSEEEEKRMAAYIVSRLPQEMLPRPADWRAFAEANPHRTLAGYVEHYRGYKARIDGYVRDMQAKPGRDDRALSVGSDDSSVVALDTPEKKTAELIDITLLDDDE